MFKSSKVMLSLLAIAVLSGCAASAPTISAPVRAGAAVAAPVYRNSDQWVYRVVRQTGKDEQISINYSNGKFAHDNQEIFDSNSLAERVSH